MCGACLLPDALRSAAPKQQSAAGTTAANAVEAGRNTFMLADAIRPLRLRIRTNPRGPILERYIAFLAGRGYSATTLREYVSAAEHFGRWLGRRPLNQAAVRQFLCRHLPVCHCRWPAIRTTRRSGPALHHLLAMSGARTDRPAFPRGF